MENNTVLAIVNGKEITGEDFNLFMQSMDPQLAQYFMAGDHKKEIIDELVNQQLLFLDAKERKLNEEDEFKKVLEKTEESLLKTYAIGKLLEEVKVEDEELKEFYEKNKDNFNEAPSVQASHILVEDLEKANEIHEKIKNGENFENLATENSTCPSSQKGGDLGMFQRGQMVPEFEEAAFSMNEGEVSEPVKTDFGYHIIKVTKKSEAKENSLEDVKEEVKREVKKFKDQTAYLDKIKDLTSKYEVEILEK